MLLIQKTMAVSGTKHIAIQFHDSELFCIGGAKNPDFINIPRELEPKIERYVELLMEVWRMEHEPNIKRD